MKIHNLIPKKSEKITSPEEAAKLVEIIEPPKRAVKEPILENKDELKVPKGAKYTAMFKINFGIEKAVKNGIEFDSDDEEREFNACSSMSAWYKSILLANYFSSEHHGLDGSTKVAVKVFYKDKEVPLSYENEGNQTDLEEVVNAAQKDTPHSIYNTKWVLPNKTRVGRNSKYDYGFMLITKVFESKLIEHFEFNELGKEPNLDKEPYFEGFDKLKNKNKFHSLLDFI